MTQADTNVPQDIEEYIAGFPDDVRAILQKVRTTIAKAAPKAKEAIKYRLPTFVQNGNLVHFGAFRKHIGFYAMPTGHTKFQRELSAYESGKGSVQFPFDKPIPYSLIRRIVKFRVKEDSEKTAAIPVLLGTGSLALRHRKRKRKSPPPSGGSSD